MSSGNKSNTTAPSDCENNNVRPRPPAAPPEINLVSVDETNISMLRRLNVLLFPVRYTQRYYQDVIGAGHIGKLAYWKGKCVGLLTCREEPFGYCEQDLPHSPPKYDNIPTSSSPALQVPEPDRLSGAMSVIANQQAQSPGSKELYLMTLGVLAPYRNVGIGSYLLDWVIQQARGDSSIGRVVLHVHTENTEALQFYSHRKFRCIKTVKDYYRNLDPPNAYLLAFDTPSPPNPRRKATVEREEPVVGAI